MERSGLLGAYRTRHVRSLDLPPVKAAQSEVRDMKFPKSDRAEPRRSRRRLWHFIHWESRADRAAETWWFAFVAIMSIILTKWTIRRSLSRTDRILVRLRTYRAKRAASEVDSKHDPSDI